MNNEANHKPRPFSHPIGVGEVTFHRLDGECTVIDNVIVDTISAIGANKNVISAELFDIDDTVVHLPFVSHWTISYRV